MTPAPLPKSFRSWGPDTEANFHLRRRTSADWVRELSKIQEGTLRIKAACIAWWDFLAGKNVSANAVTPDLRALLDAWRPDHTIDEPSLRDALLLVGYPPASAANRAVHYEVPAAGRKKEYPRKSNTLLEALSR